MPAFPAPPPIERIARGRTIGLPLVETLGAIRRAGAARITWHRHARCFELLLVLDGATAYEFADGRTVQLTGGKFLLVPPGAAHRGAGDVRQPATLCGIAFDPSRARAAENTPFTARELSLLARQFSRAPLAARPLGPELRRLALALSRHLAGEETTAPALAAATLRTIVCSALLEAARQLTPAPGLRPGAAAVAEAVRAHLQRRLAEPLSIPALVRLTGYSRARLFQLFRETTGTTPNDCLQRLRIERARELLTRGRQSVTAIAHEVGFATSQYFSKVFRKYAGKAPREFRGGGGHPPGAARHTI